MSSAVSDTSIITWQDNYPTTDTNTPAGTDSMAGVLDDQLRNIKSVVRQESENKQWIRYLGLQSAPSTSAPSYISSTSFSLPGDWVTPGIMQVNRRIVAICTGGNYTGSIATATYNGVITTVTLTMDSTGIDASMTEVMVGALTDGNGSVPTTYLNVGRAINFTQVANGGTAAWTGTVPGMSALVAGQTYVVEWTVGPVGATTAQTLNLNSLGAKNIYKVYGDLGGVQQAPVPLLGADISIGVVTPLYYNGTNFYVSVAQLPNVTVAIGLTNSGGGAWTGALDNVPSSLPTGAYLVQWNGGPSVGSDTVNINGLGAKAVYKTYNGAPGGGTYLANLQPGEIQNGMQTWLLYNGTYFNLYLPSLSPTSIAGRVAGNPALDVVNSTAETTLGTLTHPAGALLNNDTSGQTSSGILRVRAFGDTLNNSGGTRTIDFKLYYGGSLLLDTGAISLTASANRRSWRVEADIAILGNNSQQYTNAQIDISGANGLGIWGNNDAIVGTGNQISTVNSALAQAVALNVILGYASASFDCRVFSFDVQIVPAQ